jgi:hypothetical protein
MRISRYITISAAVLAAGLFVSCSKSPSKAVAKEAQLHHDLSIPANVPINDLGVIELAPNVPKHIKVGDADWIITENRDASGKQKITAESAGRKVTQKDIADSSVPPNTKIGSTITEAVDLTGLPTGVEIIGYFGDKVARYTLKHDAN